jgi:hypothetical protein
MYECDIDIKNRINGYTEYSVYQGFYLGFEIKPNFENRNYLYS